jgi:hypothetical protein
MTDVLSCRSWVVMSVGLAGGSCPAMQEIWLREIVHELRLRCRFMTEH